MGIAADEYIRPLNPSYISELKRKAQPAMLNFLSLLGKMVIVGIAHVVVGFLLYYGRIKNLSPVFESDLLVLYMPAILAFSGYFYIAWPHTFLTYRLHARLGIVTMIAIVATIISCMCWATVAFNTFGS